MPGPRWRRALGLVALLAGCTQVGPDYQPAQSPWLDTWSTPLLEQAKAILREQVAFYDQDRYFGPDIEQSAMLVRDGNLNALVPAGILCSF